MPVRIGSATDNHDLFDQLVDFLQSSSDGPEWELLSSTTGGESALFRASGLSDDQNIYFGFDCHSNGAADAYAIGIWMFRSYNPALDHYSQPGMSAIRYLPVWNTTTPFWFVANGQRVVIIAKISTVYPSAHAGKLLPGATPGEYPQPFYVAAPVASPDTRWSTISENDRCFFDPGSSAQISLPNGSWRRVQNFFESGGEVTQSNSNFVWPYTGNVANASAVQDRYRELRENIDGTYPLWALTLLGNDPSPEIYGDIDGVFGVTGFNSATENIITIAGVDHLVIQNMGRTTRYYYAAVRLD